MSNTAQSIYNLQKQLAEYESKDDLTYQEAADAAVIRDQVWEGQDSLGGEVFRIAEVKIEKLQAKIEKLAKRAAKLGITPPTLTDTGEREDQELKDRGQTTTHTWAYVAINGSTPILNGWTFVATLQHEDEGTIIRQVPALRLPDQQREKFQQHLDALAQFRNAKPVCDHCEKVRKRKDTYVVVHEDGTLKQVGTNCLADFLGGLSPQQAAKSFEYIFSAIDEAKSYESQGFSGITVDPTWDTEFFLTHVALKYRTQGWVPRARAYDGKIATADAAANNMFDQNKQTRDRMGCPMWEDPTDEDAEVAQATIAYIRDEWENDSDFGHNLTTVLASDQIKYRNFGFAAAAVMVYQRDRQQKIEREKANVNEYVGQPKDRSEFKLTVTSIKTIFGDYGESYLHTMLDETGHRFKWFGSYELEEGTTYEGKWTIKKHDEWKGMKSTVITRPAKLEEV